MPRIVVFYYSRTGNTEKMAQAVAEGCKSISGIEVDVSYYLPPEQLVGFDAILVGSPTYHHDMPSTIKSYFEEAAVKNIVLKDKVAAVFGSYGWSGEAPKLVIEILKNKFRMNVSEPPFLIKYTPDQTGLERCSALGKRVAESLIPKA